MTPDREIRIRKALEDDVEEIRALFEAVYGKDYAFPQFFDAHFLKKLIFNDDCLILVAEDRGTGRLLGTGSVVYDVGAFTDLVGEFGRLVVHPDGRGLGIGNRLMEERLARVADYLHVGLADNRVEHLFSQKISLRHGFVPVGYLPIHNGEPVALFARYFNEALSLRRNHPHIAPDLHWLANATMDNAGLECDAIVDDTAASYPSEEDFELEEMTGRAYAALLAFERGRLRDRDIFGPVKLHFGMRALERHDARYMLARRNGRVVGAIGYARDTNVDNAVRIFELIYLNEKPVRFLLSQLDRRCREEWQVDYIETDVSADAPRMQKTLLELGFLPTAYIPSAVFHYTERLDTVRMAKFFVPVSGAGVALVDAMKPIAEGVIARFNQQWIEPLLEKSLPETPVFSGLNREQRARLANLFHTARFEGGDWLVREGARDGKAYVLTSGTAEVVKNGNTSADVLRPGEFVGEIALLNGAPHSAGIRALETVVGAVIDQQDLRGLLLARGDIGMLLYRNLATGLGAKLTRATANPDQAREKP